MKFLTLFAISLFAGSAITSQAAESYLVMEANTGRVLLAYNTEKKRPVAHTRMKGSLVVWSGKRDGERRSVSG